LQQSNNSSKTAEPIISYSLKTYVDVVAHQKQSEVILFFISKTKTVAF